jgi:hypothetical protein
LPNVGPYIYIYMTLNFLASQRAPYIYDISRLRVNTASAFLSLRIYVYVQLDAIIISASNYNFFLK